MIKKIIINSIVLLIAYHTSALAGQTDKQLKIQPLKIVTLEDIIDLAPHANPKQHFSGKLIMTPMGTPDKGSFSTYFHDGCNEYANNITNEDELRDLGMRRCKDGSVSFEQPDSTGYNGYEGKCGQTAASNVMYAYCKIIVSPDVYTNAYLSDYTPGVRPDTIKKGLNKMFAKNYECPDGIGKKWHYYSYDTQVDYIDAIERGLKNKLNPYETMKITREDGKKVSRTPVPLLIRSPGGQILHWITAVDIVRKDNKCDMFVNHWDGQYKVPCGIIGKWSRGVGNSYGAVFDKYTVIKLN